MALRDSEQPRVLIGDTGSVLRSMLAAATVAGCYRPHTVESCTVTCADNMCPAGLECHAGICRTAGDDCSDAGVLDGPGEAMVDAAPSKCDSSAPWTFNQIGTLAGVNYTLDAAPSIAIFTDTSGHIVSAPPNSDVVTPVFNDTSLSAPHLAADGGEIFMRRDTGGSTYQFVVSTRVGGVWQTPTPLVMRDPSNNTIVIQAGDRPGNATARGFGPRRMMMFLASPIRLLELEEKSPGMWKEIDSYSISDLQVTNFNEANLTDDGLHLAYVADNPTTMIVYSNRANMTARFGNAIYVYGSAGQVPHSPYMTRSCDRLFVTIQQSASFPINVGQR